MGFINSAITQSVADDFFGGGCFIDYDLESILRYCAIKNSNGDLQKISTIKTGGYSYYSHSCGNDFTQTEKELTVVYSGGSGIELPTINIENWEALDSPPFPVAPFLSKFSETKIYINKTEHKAVVFVKTLTDNWKNAFTSSIFRVLPWRFNDGNITEEEKDLFRSIGKREYTKAQEILDKCVKETDFATLYKNKVLNGWVKTINDAAIKEIEEDVADIRNEINSYLRGLSELNNKIARKNKELTSVKAACDNDSSSLVEFFKQRKQLNIISFSKSNNRASENKLEYSIDETIDYYDKDEFLSVFNRQNSYMGCFSPEVRKLLYFIFAEEKAKIRTSCAFSLRGLSSLDYVQCKVNPETQREALPHPHIANYGCLGGNAVPINQAMSEGNWDVAIDQTIAAAKNLNFGDKTVVNKMVSQINSNWYDVKFILTEDGKKMTPAEFLEAQEEPIQTKQEVQEETQGE